VYRYKLSIAYDGTAYSGWQIQHNGLSIQEEIEKALSIVLRTPCKIIGSGRTDAGVHACSQIAHFQSPIWVDTQKLLYSLNGLLAKDIRITSCSRVSEDFHAQHAAVSKVYDYHLCLGKVMLPFDRRYSWHIPYAIDIKKMKESSCLMLGKKDFSSFANEAHRGSASIDPVRELKRIDFIQEKDKWRVEFEGDGFLYKMVRNLMGTLVDIGLGKLTKETIPEIFSAKDRRFAGTSAPPHGLFLLKVDYPKSFEMENIP
jgi:tRNA pseudouridine38-40 synthase